MSSFLLLVFHLGHLHVQGSRPLATDPWGSRAWAALPLALVLPTLAARAEMAPALPRVVRPSC